MLDNEEIYPDPLSDVDNSSDSESDSDLDSGSHRCETIQK